MDEATDLPEDIGTAPSITGNEDADGGGEDDGDGADKPGDPSSSTKVCITIFMMSNFISWTNAAVLC
jgi:hypothetical protein